MNTVLVTIPCEAGELSGVRRWLRAWLDESGVDSTLREDVVLGVHEAAANAIEHAGPAENVQIAASIDDRTLTIDVIDTGNWLEGTRDDDERGRGLLIIEKVAEHVDSRRHSAGTTVRLTFRV